MHVALLRGINLPGHDQIAMSDLVDLFGRLKFKRVQSWLRSGNIVFEGDGRPTVLLECILEEETQKELGVRPDYFIRTWGEWREIVDHNPFTAVARNDPGHLVVMCLKKEPAASDLEALQAAIRGPEIVRPGGRQVYISYPAGIGTSKLTSTVIERTLGTRTTFRNWNTVLKLLSLMTK